MAKKILHILGSLAIGGAENLVLDMLKGGTARPEGEQMPEYHVIYRQPGFSGREEEFRATGALVTLYPCGKGIRKTFLFIHRLRRYIKEHGIQIIHCHNNIDAYWAYFAVGSRKIPIVLTVHGFNLNLNFLSGKLFGGSSLRPGSGIHYPDRQILKNFRIVFVSGQGRNYYLKNYRGASAAWGKNRSGIFLENAPVIYNGIDAGKFLQASSLDPGELWPLPKGSRPPADLPRIFAMAGSFNSPARRKQQIICRALNLLKEKNGSLPCKFLFIGAPNSNYPHANDPREDEYAACREFCKEKRLENDIFFLPPRSDIPRVLRSVDGYVYASEWDTFGLSVMEAVISGIPVICSDIPTFREVTLGGELATLAENTPEDFARAIEELLREQREDEKSVSAGNGANKRSIFFQELKELRAKAIELYSIDVCIRNYHALYNELF